VQVAFWIWVAGAVLSLVYAVLVGDITNPSNGVTSSGLTQAQYAQYVHTLVVVTIVELVVLAALYVFFAYKVRAGRNWARMTMTVLVVIGVAFDAYTGSLFTISGGVLLISVIAVVLVYLPASNAYFAARKRLR
jgi:hypothetical protein